MLFLQFRRCTQISHNNIIVASYKTQCWTKPDPFPSSFRSLPYIQEKLCMNKTQLFWNDLSIFIDKTTSVRPFGAMKAFKPKRSSIESLSNLCCLTNACYISLWKQTNRDLISLFSWNKLEINNVSSFTLTSFYSVKYLWRKSFQF